MKHKMLSGVFWQGLASVGNKGLNFLFSIILARLLAPEDFGCIAILMIFIVIAEVFCDSGFVIALVQKKDADDIDCSCVFYINILVSLVLYLIFFCSAPWIAQFYRDARLCTYFRWLALGTVIRAFALVQWALLTKRMLFQVNFKLTIGTLAISGPLGITLAYCNFGVWALIIQHLASMAITTIMLWWMVKWRPQWIFVWARVKTLFRFGSKMLVTSLLDTAFNNLFGLVVGRIFNLTILAYYNRGRHIPETGMSVINSTISAVTLPAFSEIQDDRSRMRTVMQKSLKIIMFFVCPAMGLLATLATPLVTVLLTEKWLPCVIFLQLSCLTFVVRPVHTLNLQVITACGRSDIMLTLEIIKKIQIVAILLLTYPLGVVSMVSGIAINSLLCALENAWPNRKLIQYSIGSQLISFLPYVIWTGISTGTTLLLVSRFHVSPWLHLGIGSVFFGIVYLGGLLLSHAVPPEIADLTKAFRLRIMQI